MDNFSQAFQNNFYLTRDWAVFCSKITRISLKEESIGNQSIFLLKNKNISISNYPNTLCNEFKRREIFYLCVKPEINSESQEPSFLDYSILHKTAYDQAFNNYKTSFFHGLREGKKFPHALKIIRQPDEKCIKEIYDIYVEQMKRHNSFVFPLSFFIEFFRCPYSLLFLIEYKQDIIAYFCCFQYKDNLYASIGGGNPRYFSYKCSNKLYDELIKYACQNNLNIHLGIGEHSSSYQKFKLNAGLINYKTERFPDDEKILKSTSPFLKFKITGKFLALLSRLFPFQTIYLTMPFT